MGKKTRKEKEKGSFARSGRGKPKKRVFPAEKKKEKKKPGDEGASSKELRQPLPALIRWSRVSRGKGEILSAGKKTTKCGILGKESPAKSFGKKRQRE